MDERMAKRIRRILSVLLTLIMVLAAIPTGTVYAATVEGEAALSTQLAQAANGECVRLEQDTEEKYVFVADGVTLDLNGCKLTAEYIMCYGDIIDSSEDNAGRLYVADKNIAIRSDNDQLPVKTDGAYAFVEVEKFNKAFNTENGKFAFQPVFEKEAIALLGNTAESGAKVVVRVSWKTVEGAERWQDFTYNPGMVNAYLASYNENAGKYGSMFTLLLSGLNNISELGYTAMVQTEAGVIASADKVDHIFDENQGTAGGNASDVETDEENKVVGDVTLENDDKTSAFVPEGTKLQENISSLMLTVSEIDDSKTDVELGENEEKKSVDVHIDGIAPDNTVPMLITLPESGVMLWHVLEKGGDCEALVKALTEEYEVTEEQARADAEAFLDRLIQYGCVEQ